MSVAPESAAASGTALYLSAIARLSAGLREVQHACERGDASYVIAHTAAGALADADRLQLPQPAPETAAEPAILTEHGALALRPALSATVVIAARDPIGEGPRTAMTAAFAQDGLQVIFAENAAAIAELPPDPALRADLAALAAALRREAEVSGPQVAAAALSIAGRILAILGEEKPGA